MKKLLAAAVVGLASLVAVDANGKAKIEYERLKVRDLIEVMAEYEIKKAAVPPAQIPHAGYQIYFGTTDPINKSIIINSMVTKDLQRVTAIHESLHVYYSSKGIDSSDEIIMKEYSCRAFREIYERDCPREDLGLVKLINPNYIKSMQYVQ